jgi:hypothetical protein
MPLPAFCTSFVAVCLAVVTAFGMMVVRTGAPRERERAVRMTRGSGQRLDSGEAVHSHEDTSVAVDFSAEPKGDPAPRLDTDPDVVGIMPRHLAVLRIPVLPVSIVSPPLQHAPKATPIPPVPGRAPPAN